MDAHKDSDQEKQEDKEHDKEFKKIYNGTSKRCTSVRIMFLGYFKATMTPITSLRCSPFLSFHSSLALMLSLNK